MCIGVLFILLDFIFIFTDLFQANGCQQLTAQDECEKRLSEAFTGAMRQPQKESMIHCEPVTTLHIGSSDILKFKCLESVEKNNMWAFLKVKELFFNGSTNELHKWYRI